jgi:DNA-binding beta-propeller fold protein YncE
VNTGDYSNQGSLTIVDPATMQVIATVQNMGVGPGAISIDANGLAYISGDSGTLVWSTSKRAFVRGTDNPVCAKVASTGKCRGAFSATTSSTGKIYQLFFGSSSQGLAPYAFVFNASTFALTDSISVGSGPSAIAIRTF